MIRISDRQGHISEEDSFQDRLLEKLYGSTAGRILLKPLVSPVISDAAAKILDSRLSALAVAPFIRAKKIKMSEYEEKKYLSYNDFFTRRIREGARNIDQESDHFISPCDCRVSVFSITGKGRVKIKHTSYTAEELLRNASLAGRFQEGYLWVFRLCVDDYHHYIYIDEGKESKIVRIPGILHTVNPAANDVYPIYKENTREYSLLHSVHFGTVLMMEVGAMLVGRIENRPLCDRVYRGQEKGNFAFGGSTVILMTQPGRVIPDGDILSNSEKGIETRVLMGEKVGTGVLR